MLYEGGIIYKELSYTINGILFAVHNELGCYAKEKQYGDILEKKLRENSIFYKREVIVGNSGNIIDFIIEDKLLVELKAKRIITKEDYNQTQRYLQETQIRLGLLVNFRDKYLRPIRVIKIDTDKKNIYTN